MSQQQAEYKAKELLRVKYTSHSTSLPTFDNPYEEAVGEMADNIYQYIYKYVSPTKARHYCFSINLDPDNYIE